MSDLISQNINMIFKTPKGETVHALKDLNFTLLLSYIIFYPYNLCAKIFNIFKNIK